jgi:Zn-dependent protease with chaperone function/uncharacterized tellurite resistance protein B-like protein
MDFFARQDQARRKTKWLLLYFVLAVAGIICLVYGIALIVYGYVGLKQSSHRLYSGQVQFAFWNLKLFLGVAVGTLAVIITGSLWKTLELAAGGSVVAKSLGGRLLSANTKDSDERRLLNVVEEMSIASGVPMPQVYVLDAEKGINAFAAGYTTADAAVAVTEGCLKMLNRDELQGVIAHEFSHVLNGDMRLNIRLIGILFGILGISAIGRILMRARGKNAAAPVFIGLLLLGVGSLGVFFGRLIQSAVSRQREYLADASAVQFTRNPSGLSGALQKIGGYGFSSWVVHDGAPDTAHLFFANGLPRSFMDAMSTHPPLDERIRAIDPYWDGKFPRVSTEKVMADARKEKREPKAVFMDGKMIILAGAVLDSEKKSAPLRPPAVVNAVGNPTPLHLRYAEELRESLPETLVAAAHEPLAATALVYALLLSDDEKVRAEQLAQIAWRISGPVSERTNALLPEVAAVARHVRLPLVNLALGALAQLEPEQYTQFSEMLDVLAAADGQISLFEFTLLKIVRRHLDRKFHPSRPQPVQYYTLTPLVPDCAVVLSILARAGQDDAGEIQKAFEAGAPYVRPPLGVPLELLSPEQSDVACLDSSLNRLVVAAPIIKKNLLEACARVVGADGVIQESEAELLRAVAETLDCPIPPLGVGE